MSRPGSDRQSTLVSMSPDRAIQLSLGVPDVIDPTRREANAVYLLARGGGADMDYADEHLERFRPLYRALVEAHREGNFDGLIAGWSPLDAFRYVKHVKSRIPREFGMHLQVEEMEKATIMAIEALMTWARTNQELDAR